MNARMTSELAVTALRNAAALRLSSARVSDGSSTVIHSDRGSQFRSHAYVRALSPHGLHGS